MLLWNKKKTEIQSQLDEGNTRFFCQKESRNIEVS